MQAVDEVAEEGRRPAVSSGCNAVRCGQVRGAVATLRWAAVWCASPGVGVSGGRWACATLRCGRSGSLRCVFA
nr:hypothetical protein Iba_chr14dCG2280 [Ipomoea batatas]